MLSYQEVLDRVTELAHHNIELQPDKLRIRNICDGGPEGIQAVMAWNKGRQDNQGKADALGDDFPAVNMVASGIDRFAQMIGIPPSLKVPYGPHDEDEPRAEGEKKERLLRSWDDMSILELAYPQLGRWLPGYGSYTWKICPKVDPVTGQMFPHVELRDPFDTFTGWLGPMQQPDDVAYRRIVPLGYLEKTYPREDWRVLENRIREVGSPDSMLYGTNRDRDWEGSKHGVALIEYVCEWGTYVCLPESGVVLDYYPNLLSTGPMFVYGKRIAFNRLISQYHHVIGLSAMLAKFNVLALIGAEQMSFSEHNIFGDMIGNTYEEGRDGFNFFERDARVERGVTAANVQPIFAQIDRLTQQLRIGAAYDEGSDSLAVRGGFITGRGQQELRDPIERNAKEYHTVLAVGARQLDMRRLEWEEKYEGSKKKRVFWIEGSKSTEETYNPAKDIAGNWRTTRIYGMMAGWDDPSKIVTALQLLQGEIIDVTEIQENLDGLTDPQTMNLRMRRAKAEKTLMFALEQRAVNGDAAATMALIDIRNNPEKMTEILSHFFTPSEPQISPEEQALMAAQQNGGGAPMEPPGGTPTVQTILSRLTGGGQAEGGVQTVGTNVV